MKKIENLSLSFDFIKNKIKQKTLENWKNQWKLTKIKNPQYRLFDMQPGQQNVKFLSKIFNKLIFFIILRMKIEYEYFRFQKKLSI